GTLVAFSCAEMTWSSRSGDAPAVRREWGSTCSARSPVGTTGAVGVLVEPRTATALQFGLRAGGAVRESPLDQVGRCSPHSRRRSESAPAGRRRTWQVTEGDTPVPHEIYRAFCRMTGTAPRDRRVA